MGLLVYKMSDYEHTAEREQFRFVCNSLKSYYSNRNELCLFMANYNVMDCEIDGILIKNDAIICVEFKNYGGKVIAAENGEWTADGVVVKGGSRKTVYQQAKLNHIAVRNGFRDGGILSAKTLRNVNALIVFNQSIVLENMLSSQVKSWLSITDNNHFIEKVEDITSKNVQLTNGNILGLLDRLALYEDSICEEYSNMELLSTQHNTIEEQNLTTATHTPVDETEVRETKEFASFIFDQLNIQDYRLECLDGRMGYGEFCATKKYIIVVKQAGIASHKNIIQDFVQRKIHIINENEICFDFGDNISIAAAPEKDSHHDSKNPNTKSAPIRPTFNSRTTLPKYIDNHIYGVSRLATYKPDYQRYTYNRDLTHDEVLNYLGTYFPRYD